ncbi:MAG: (d)CMP kinase [Erysipelotrichaceae bacterium]|nr:(d)CMP kinase [Erysipelotrichaceae bacterium]
MKKISIAIDGPSASGKSTAAKIVAKKLNYIYIDTGAMYRSVCLYCLSNDIDIKDEAAVSAALIDIDIDIDEKGAIFLNGTDVSKEIRQDNISIGASVVSQYQKVRDFLVSKQQQIAASGGVVMDGRDIGTVVLKNAQLKIFQVASSKTRALRRYHDNIERGLEADYEKILEEIEHRDYQDTHRQISPLKKADDAIEIDTSHKTIEEVVGLILELVKEKEAK